MMLSQSVSAIWVVSTLMSGEDIQTLTAIIEFFLWWEC